MTKRFVCLVDDPSVFDGAPGLRSHHAQRELGGTQWVAVVYGDAATLDHLEAAGATIVDEAAEAATEIPLARAQKLGAASRPLPGERAHALMKRATGGFDVRKF
jgi:hypothetical protein